MLRRVPVLLPLLSMVVLAGPAWAADGGIDAPSSPSCGAVTIKGCCEGLVLRYCESGVLRSEDCSAKPSCGWRSELNYYACGSSGGSDPSGKHAKVCPTANADAGADQGTPPPADSGPARDGAKDGSSDGSSPDAFIWHTPDSGTLPPSDAAGDARKPQPISDPGCGCRSGGNVDGALFGPWLVLLIALAWQRQRERRRREAQPQ